MADNGTPDIDWKGRDVVDPEGDKVGSIEEVYVDAESGRPQWLLVKRGVLALGTVFVPAEGADEDGDRVRVPYAKQTVADAPHYEPGTEVDTEREAAIYRHYELEPPERASEDDDEGDEDETGESNSESEGDAGDEDREAGEDREAEG